MLYTVSLASLTTLCTELGVTGVQVEELPSMDEAILRDMRYELLVELIEIRTIQKKKQEKSERERMTRRNEHENLKKSYKKPYSRPVYGLILLARHKPERALRDDSVTPNSDIFFANQVRHEPPIFRSLYSRLGVNVFLMSSIPCSLIPLFHFPYFIFIFLGRS